LFSAIEAPLSHGLIPNQIDKFAELDWLWENFMNLLFLRLTIKRSKSSAKTKSLRRSWGFGISMWRVLFQNEEPARLSKCTRLQSVEVHSTRKPGSLELHVVNSGIPPIEIDLVAMQSYIPPTRGAIPQMRLFLWIDGRIDAPLAFSKWARYLLRKADLDRIAGSASPDLSPLIVTTQHFVNYVRALMQLRRRALGLTIGVPLGLGMFVEIIWAVFERRSSALENLTWYCPGITVSLGGAFIACAWGLAYGFIFGASFAWLYNAFCKVLYKSGPL